MAQRRTKMVVSEGTGFVRLSDLWCGVLSSHDGCSSDVQVSTGFRSSSTSFENEADKGVESSSNEGRMISALMTSTRGGAVNLPVAWRASACREGSVHSCAETWLRDKPRTSCSRDDDATAFLRRPNMIV